MTRSSKARKGSKYNTKDEAYARIIHRLVKRSTPWKVVKNDDRCIHLKCKHDDCPVHVLCRYLESKDEWIITSCKKTHLRDCLVRRKKIAFTPMQIALAILPQAIREHKTDRDSIKAMHKKLFKKKINSVMAWKVQQHLNDKHFNKIYNITKMEAFFEDLKLKNPNTVAIIEKENGVFKRFFLCIGSVAQYTRLCNGALYVDATFLTGSIPGIYMVASAMDAGGSFQVAKSMGKVECHDDWSFFFSNLKEAMDLVGVTPSIIMSDRHASIKYAVSRYFPNSKHLHCLRHLEKNIKKHFKENAKKLNLYAAAKAFTESEFDDYFFHKDVSFDLQIFLWELGPSHWAQSHHQLDLYGQYTNNIAESLNSKIKDILSQEPFQMVYDLVQKSNEQITDIDNKICKSKGITEYCNRKIRENTNDGKEFDYTAIVPGVEGRVKLGRVGAVKEWDVNLKARTCTCGQFQACGYPCVHAARMIDREGLVPEDYVDLMYESHIFKDSRDGVRVVQGSISNLAENNMQSPPTRTGPGRHTIRRISTPHD